MKLLAIDTATEALSAALWLDGEIIERYSVVTRAQQTTTVQTAEPEMDFGVRVMAACEVWAMSNPASAAVDRRRRRRA